MEPEDAPSTRLGNTPAQGPQPFYAARLTSRKAAGYRRPSYLGAPQRVETESEFQLG
jgi:hypothetical protein